MIFFILAWLVSVFTPGHPVLASISNEQVSLAAYIYQTAVEYKIDPKLFLKLANCESQIDNGSKGDWSIEEKKYKARGVFQWWYSSWVRYSKQYQFNGDYWNARDQIQLAAIVISGDPDGIYNWKTCGKQSGFFK